MFLIFSKSKFGEFKIVLSKVRKVGALDFSLYEGNMLLIEGGRIPSAIKI